MIKYYDKSFRRISPQKDGMTRRRMNDGVLWNMHVPTSHLGYSYEYGRLRFDSFLKAWARSILKTCVLTDGLVCAVYPLMLPSNVSRLRHDDRYKMSNHSTPRYHCRHRAIRYGRWKCFALRARKQKNKKANHSADRMTIVFHSANVPTTEAILRYFFTGSQSDTNNTVENGCYYFCFFFFFVPDEDGEKSVSVLLDAEESELIFLDKSYSVSKTNAKHIYVLHRDWTRIKPWILRFCLAKGPNIKLSQCLKPKAITTSVKIFWKYSLKYILIFIVANVN